MLHFVSCFSAHLEHGLYRLGANASMSVRPCLAYPHRVRDLVLAVTPTAKQVASTCELAIT